MANYNGQMSRYTISQDNKEGIYEVVDTEHAGNASQGEEIIGRYENLRQALNKRDQWAMFDALETAGLGCRRYDSRSDAIVEVVKFLHAHLCRLDGHNLRKVSEMSVFDLANCYPAAFPEHCVRRFGDKNRD